MQNSPKNIKELLDLLQTYVDAGHGDLPLYYPHEMPRSNNLGCKVTDVLLYDDKGVSGSGNPTHLYFH